MCVYVLSAEEGVSGLGCAETHTSDSGVVLAPACVSTGSDRVEGGLTLVEGSTWGPGTPCEGGPGGVASCVAVGVGVVEGEGVDVAAFVGVCVCVGVGVEGSAVLNLRGFRRAALFFPMTTPPSSLSSSSSESSPFVLELLDLELRVTPTSAE